MLIAQTNSPRSHRNISDDNDAEGSRVTDPNEVKEFEPVKDFVAFGERVDRPPDLDQFKQKLNQNKEKSLRYAAKLQETLATGQQPERC